MIVTRFAPSPTGFLHLGHAYAAVYAYRGARSAGGRFLLRIEDIDFGRCRAEYAQAIMEDLAWLGLRWDGDVRLQSAHLAEYRTVLDALDARGLLYPCFCTRTEILREVENVASAPHAPDGSPVYPGTCRNLSAAERQARIASGNAYVLRLDMARALRHARPGLSFFEEGEGSIACRPERFGDVVLARKDAPASYHLCVTHDDARQGVTLVTRGADLKPATDLHRLLQELLDWPVPRYAHHALLTDASGKRLAKRDYAATLRELRARGVTPEQVHALTRISDCVGRGTCDT
jgi:glutamyl-Q tRNA(Asp) synthetase